MSVFGVLLAVLGIVIGGIGGLLAGVIGGVAGVVLAAVGILLGFLAKRNSDKGTGAIVVGILAVLVSIGAAFGGIKIVKTLRAEAQRTETAPLLEKYAENPNFGLVGVLLNVAKDEESVDELMKQIEALNKAEETAAAGKE